MNKPKRLILSLVLGLAAAGITVYSQNWLASEYPQKIYWDMITVFGAFVSGNMHQGSSVAMMGFVILVPALAFYIIIGCVVNVSNWRRKSRS